MGTGNRPKFSAVAATESSLASFPDEIAADLWRYYNGLDLRDLWRPGGGTSRLTYRMLSGLLANLPGESAYKTAARDSLGDEQLAELAKRPREGHGPWSNSDLLTATIIDHLRAVIYAIYASQGAKPKEPEPYPRPGIAAPRRRKIGQAQLNHLQRLRDEHAALHGYSDETQQTG